jgi:hypothetical protein
LHADVRAAERLEAFRAFLGGKGLTEPELDELREFRGYIPASAPFTVCSQIRIRRMPLEYGCPG